jgi:hypothetical protein
MTLYYLTTISLLGSNLVSLEAKPSGFHSQIQVSEEIALLPLLHGTVHYINKKYTR